jgi:capsular exopolysaccharide synthesis family protein
MSQENLVEFEDYVAAIGRRKKLIVVVVAAFVVLGAAYSVLSTKEYSSESRVLVTPVFDASDGTTEAVNIDTERGIARSSAVATIAQGILGSDTSPSDLLDRVSVDPVGDSEILSIRYTHTDPEAAFRGAAAFAEAYLQFRTDQADEATRSVRQQLNDEKTANDEQRASLETQLDGLEPGTREFQDVQGQIQALDGAQSRIDSQLRDLGRSAADPGTITDEAEIPSSPSNPGLLLNVAGAALIGLVLALTATFVLERRNLGRQPEADPAPPVEPTPPAPAAAIAAPTPPPAPALAAPEPAVAPTPAPVRPALESALPVASTPVERPAPEPAPTPAPQPARSRTVAALPAATPPEPAEPARDFTPRPLVVDPTPPARREPAPAPAATPAAPARPTDRRTRRDPSQALAGLKVELLGNVPRLSNDEGEAAFDAVALGGPSGEALRRLHATLWPRLEQQGARVVFITSAIERGVTVGLAGGLAATAALAGQDALLIAGDLHHPQLHDRLELGNDQGLAEVLSGNRPMSQVLQGWSGIENLCVVTAGRPGPDPSSLVSADRLAAQLATVRNEFQLIVIEGPPVGDGSDATVMASVSDAVVLAVDPRHSAENELGGAVSRLRLAGAPLVGAVVVEARAARTGIPPVATPVPSRG